MSKDNKETRDYSKEIRNFSNYLVNYSLSKYSDNIIEAYRSNVLAEYIKIYESKFISDLLINMFKTDDPVRSLIFTSSLIKM